MRRKLVKQGDNALTLTVPAAWAKENKLAAGDEVEIENENNQLVISSGAKKQVKSVAFTLQNQHDFRLYRSLLGAYYRAGFDEIKIQYDSPKVIPELQKAVDFLYGFEIFEQKENVCIIKKMYESESTELQLIVTKMIQTIKTMQNIILRDIAGEKHASEQELLQFRNNVLKYRDIIVRAIVYHKLLDEKNFPYNNIAYSLWQIARVYYNLYLSLPRKKAAKQELTFFNKVNNYFISILQREEMHHAENHERYRKLVSQAEGLIRKSKNPVFLSYCISLVMNIQSCNSMLFLQENDQK
ncbi:AbrB/MazE/SpoVT family DNA-binding domain-containing protein [Candidatus Woesearchaeota archaeon]|nr:AbrB/MazE/SpoVT family DNA-binding domain-containing protein [Candidatus Woesearchaeota archaeon]